MVLVSASPRRTKAYYEFGVENASSVQRSSIYCILNVPRVNIRGRKPVTGAPSSVKYGSKISSERRLRTVPSDLNWTSVGQPPMCFWQSCRGCRLDVFGTKWDVLWTSSSSHVERPLDVHWTSMVYCIIFICVRCSFRNMNVNAATEHGRLPAIKLQSQLPLTDETEVRQHWFTGQSSARYFAIPDIETAQKMTTLFHCTHYRISIFSRGCADKSGENRSKKRMATPVSKGCGLTLTGTASLKEQQSRATVHVWPGLVSRLHVFGPLGC